MTALRPVHRSLGLLAAAACGGTALLVVALVLVAVAAAGGGPAAVGAGIGLGTAVAVAVAVAAAAAGARVETALRAVADRAVGDPRTDVRPVALGRLARHLPALVDVDRGVTALHRRVRVADELAERHRATAVTTGAGVGDLLTALVEAEEGARGRLAADLHDTVAQSLQLARGLLATDLEASTLRRVSTAVEDAEEEVRALLARTRPPALRGGDLAGAVGDLRADLWTRYGLRVDVTWPAADLALGLPAATTVYRFFQEALLNVVKHADVDRAAARLAVQDGVLLAEVVDAGPGGAPPLGAAARAGRSVGLALLRERARLTGGTVELSSPVGTGTTVSLRLPLAGGAAAGWRSVTGVA